MTGRFLYNEVETEAWPITWDKARWFVRGVGEVLEEVFWACAEPLSERRLGSRRLNRQRLGKGRRWADRTAAAIYRCADCDDLIEVQDGWAVCRCNRPTRDQRASA